MCLPSSTAPPRPKPPARSKELPAPKRKTCYEEANAPGLLRVPLCLRVFVAERFLRTSFFTARKQGKKPDPQFLFCTYHFRIILIIRLAITRIPNATKNFPPADLPLSVGSRHFCTSASAVTAGTLAG